MAKGKYNQITIEPISLSKMQDYAYFFSGLPLPVSSEDVAMTLGVKTETVRLPSAVTPKDVAIMLGVKTETVKRWLKKGDLERLDITSLEAFIDTKPEHIRATYTARMTIFSVFINEAVKQICGTLAFSISLVNTVEQLGTLRNLAALPSMSMPVESLVYENLLPIYGVFIQFPYSLVKEYTRQTCNNDKIFISGCFQESALEVIKNGGTPYVTRRGGCHLEELEKQYAQHGHVTIDFIIRANRPINEGTSFDTKHKDLEVDDG